jgi:hypothetical protein
VRIALTETSKVVYGAFVNPDMETNMKHVAMGDNIETIRQLLAYDPETGLVTWKQDHMSYEAGAQAGYIRKDGTYVIWFGDRERAAGPIIWALVHGEFPKGRVRYRNGKSNDTRLSNLYVPAGAWKTVEAKNQQSRDRRVADPDYFRNADLKKNFGITLEQYAEILKEQHGVCAICQQPETAIREGKLKMLAVDHCHTGGHNRGLLCQDCNLGLGRFHDDPVLLRRAADYAEYHASKVVPLKKDSA